MIITKPKNAKCVSGVFILYLCAMEKDITIQVPRKEDLAAANRRREEYAATRDLKAMELNAAIAARLLAETRNMVKCEKCGKEFSAGKNPNDSLICPDCR